MISITHQQGWVVSIKVSLDTVSRYFFSVSINVSYLILRVSKKKYLRYILGCIDNQIFRYIFRYIS